jgi:hypothetical protein
MAHLAKVLAIKRTNGSILLTNTAAHEKKQKLFWNNINLPAEGTVHNQDMNCTHTMMDHE